jgi:anti-sigma-K factor RskA
VPPPAPVIAAAPAQRFVAVVNDSKGQPLWLLACYKGPDQVRIQPVRAPAAPGGKDYELWLVSGEGGPAPISLGVLGGLNRTVHLAPAQAQIMWQQAQAFAVSEEPLGGSPTGQPTGPVRHVAPMVPSI